MRSLPGVWVPARGLHRPRRAALRRMRFSSDLSGSLLRRVECRRRANFRFAPCAGYKYKDKAQRGFSGSGTSGRRSGTTVMPAVAGESQLPGDSPVELWADAAEVEGILEGRGGAGAGGAGAAANPTDARPPLTPMASPRIVLAKPTATLVRRP